MNGIVTCEGGKAIPEGVLKVYLEDTTIRDASLRRIAQTQLESDGQSASLPFVLTPAAAVNGAASLEVVARLERPDGWLLARGSARFDASGQASVTLNTVTY